MKLDGDNFEKKQLNRLRLLFRSVGIIVISFGLVQKIGRLQTYSYQMEVIRKNSDVCVCVCFFFCSQNWY